MKWNFTGGRSLASAVLRLTLTSFFAVPIDALANPIRWR
jgi:hypothetical protein